VELGFLAWTIPKKVSLKTPNFLAMHVGNGKRNKKYVSRLNRVLLIRLKAPSLRQVDLLPTSPHFFYLKEAPRGTPKYFKGSGEMLQLRISASSSFCGTSSTATNLDFWMFTFKLEITSKQRRM